MLQSIISISLTFKVPNITAADDKFGKKFPNFQKNKVYYMRIVYQQMIIMKYHALFAIFEKKKKQQNLKLSSAANYRW